MNVSPQAGLAGQAGARTFFRVAGVVLVPVGIAVLVYGIVNVFGHDGYGSPPARYIVAFLGGLPITGVGLMCLNVGFLGAIARYGAGETMPVVKDSASYLSDGQGVLGVGRIVDDEPAASTGPYCRSCGTRNDDDARHCDGCGAALV